MEGDWKTDDLLEVKATHDLRGFDAGGHRTFNQRGMFGKETA